MKNPTMKKIVIVLIVAYLGIFAFRAYQRIEYNQKRSDQHWQYFKKVIFGKDIDILPISHNDSLLQWDENIKLQIDGHPSNEDVNTIKKTASQLSTLILPKQIEFTDYSGNIELAFLNKSEMWTFTNGWPKNALAECEIKGSIIFKDGKFDKTNVWKAEITISTDSTTQLQKNNYIVKGMAYAFLCLGRHPNKKFSQHEYGENGTEYYTNYRYSYYDTKGNFDQFYSGIYPNSIFNSSIMNCTELTDIDKYIIKTYYSPDLDKIIKDHNVTFYFESYTTLKNILLALCCAIILLLYFSGFFGRTLFAFVNNHVKGNWLAFNFKTLSILLITIAIYILSLLGLYYLSYPAHTEYIDPGFHLFLFDQNAVIIILIAFILILVNGIYLIENVVIMRFEQFALQQFFSFMFFVSGIIFGAYLLNRLFVLQDNIFLISFYAGSLLGLTRFLFNYSNYQKKVVLIDKEKEIIALRELKIRAELNALQSKITPHFLYNALNSIAGLAHENADKVEQMAIALSKLFRYSINKEETDFATIKNEVEMVALYLEIEKVRFDDRLQYSIDIADDLLDEKIPMFIIQPLVENAIKHGIANVTGQATLTLTIFRDKNQLLIKVSDNGPAFPEDLITGFGLQGIYEKLDILYPCNYEIKMQNGKDKNISILLGE